jgi:hypothetical protein
MVDDPVDKRATEFAVSSGCDENLARAGQSPAGRWDFITDIGC